MNTFLRTILFASSLAPALLFSAVAQLWATDSDFESYCWIVASALTCLLPLLIIIEARRRTESMPFKAKKVESQDWLLVVFIVSYFIPIATKVTNVQTLACVFVIAAVLAATLEAIPTHPILHAFRYRFYKVEGENGIVYTMITRKPMLKAADIKSVRQLSSQLLMDD